jgi:hypothetical protein
MAKSTDFESTSALCTPFTALLCLILVTATGRVSASIATPDIADVTPYVPIPNGTVGSAPTSRLVTCDQLGSGGGIHVVETRSMWLSMLLRPANQSTCTLMAQCPQWAPHARVLVASLTSASVTNADPATGISNGSSLASPTDEFFTQPGRVVKLTGKRSLYQGLVLILCYIAPCQSNVTNPVEVTSAMSEYYTFDQTAKFLKGEWCVYRGPECPFGDPTGPGVAGFRLQGKWNTELTFPDFDYLGAGLPFLIYTDNMTLLFPPNGDIDLGGQHSSDGSWRFVEAFERTVGGRVHVATVGPFNIPSHPARVMTTRNFLRLRFACYSVACPSNGSLIGYQDVNSDLPEDEFEVIYGGERLLNADCHAPVACASRFRQLRLFNVSTCRPLVWTACAEALSRNTDPEQYTQRIAPICSESLSVFAPSKTDYRCNLQIRLQCIRVCHSPNRTVNNSEWVLSARDDELDGTPTSINITNDADGPGLAVLPGFDSGCSFQTRCKNPGETVLWQITGRQAALDNLKFYNGPRGDATYLANTRTGAYMANMRVPIIGSSRTGLVVYEQRFKDESADQGQGFQATVSCITKTSFTCSIEDEILWPGKEVQRTYAGFIPFLDTCSWRFRCPAGMYAAASLRFNGGYADEYYQYGSDGNTNDDKYDSTRFVVSNRFGEEVGRIVSGQGIIYSTDELANVTFNSTGLRSTFEGSYNVTFDCWVSPCPLNATEPMSETRADFLNFSSSMIYQNNIALGAVNESARPWCVVNSRCEMTLSCRDSTHTTYFNFTGYAGSGGYFNISGEDGDPTLQKTLTIVSNPARISWGVFLYAPVARVRWQGAKAIGHNGEFTMLLGCAPKPCSLWDFDPRAQERRVATSPPFYTPTWVDDDEWFRYGGGRINELDTFKNYVYENCTLDLECPDTDETQYAVPEISGRLAALDQLWLFDPLNATTTLRTPNAFWGGIIYPGWAAPEGAMVMSGRRAAIRIETFLDGRSWRANAQGQVSGNQFAGSQFNHAVMRCLASRCPANVTQTPIRIVAAPDVAGGVQFSDVMRNDGSPFARFQPYRALCQWHVSCPNPATQRLWVRYAFVVLGFAAVNIGDQSFSDGGVGSLSRAGDILLPLGESLNASYSNELAGFAYVDNALMTAGFLFDARCIASQCTMVDRTDMPSTVVSVADRGVVTIVAGVPVTDFAFTPRIPPRWRANILYRYMDDAKISSPFLPSVTAGEACDFDLACPAHSDTPHVTYSGNVSNSIVNADEIAGVFVLFNATTGALLSEDPAMDAFGLSRVQNPPMMGTSGHTFRVKLRPVHAGIVNWRVTIRCFVGSCCNNVTQPQLLGPDTPDYARRPSWPIDPDLCGPSTERQNCSWVTPVCTRLSQALVTHPVTPLMTLVLPREGSPEVLGRSAFHVLAGKQVIIAYAVPVHATGPFFGADGLVLGSCFTCNTSDITEPTSIQLPSAGVALPFFFSCSYQFRCETFAYPRLALRGIGQITSPAVRNMFRTSWTSVRLQFEQGYDEVLGRNVTDDVTIGLPVPPDVHRGMYGLHHTLAVRFDSAPITDNRYGLLFDIDFTCDIQPCVVHSPFPPAVYSDQLGKPPSDSDYFGIEKYVPSVPSTQIIQLPLSYLAFGRQRCRWRYVPACDGRRCQVQSVFRLVARDWGRRLLNASEHNAWDAATGPIVALNPSKALDFIDSESGADYMTLFINGTGMRDFDDRLKRAVFEQYAIFTGSQNFTLSLDTKPSAFLLTSEFPAVDWQFGVQSATITKSKTRPTQSFSVSTPMTPTIHATRTKNRASPTWTAFASPSASPTRAVSPTVSLQPSSSKSMSSSASNINAMWFDNHPPEFLSSVINGGRSFEFSQVHQRAVVIRVRGSRFSVANVLAKRLPLSIQAQLEVALKDLLDAPDSASVYDRYLRAIELTHTFVSAAERNFTANSSATLYPPTWLDDVRAAQASMLTAIRSEVEFTTNVPPTSSMFAARRGAIMTPESILYASSEWLVIVLQMDAHYFTVRPETVAVRISRDVLTNKQVVPPPVRFRITLVSRSVLSRELSTGVQGVMVASAVFAVSVTSALNFARNEFIMKLGPCEFDPTEQPEAIEYPFQIAVTDHPLKYRIGQTLFNPVVLFCCVSLHMLVVMLLSEWTRRTLKEAATAVFFPSFLLIPALILYEPSLTASILVASMDTHMGVGPHAGIISDGWRGAGIGDIAAIVLLVFTSTYYVIRYFRAEMSDIDLNAGRMAHIFMGSRQWINRVIRPSRDEHTRALRRRRRRTDVLRLIYTDPAAEGFAERWGRFFDAYTLRAPWFLLAELAQVTAISMMTAFAPGDGDCGTLSIIATAVYLLMCVLTLGFRPYRAAAEAGFQTMAVVVQLCACIFTAVGHLAAPSMRGLWFPLAEIIITVMAFAEFVKSLIDLYLEVKALSAEPPPPTLLSAADEKRLQRHVQRDRAGVAAAIQRQNRTAIGNSSRSSKIRSSSRDSVGTRSASALQRSRRSSAALDSRLLHSRGAETSDSEDSVEKLFEHVPTLIAPGTTRVQPRSHSATSSNPHPPTTRRGYRPPSDRGLSSSTDEKSDNDAVSDRRNSLSHQSTSTGQSTSTLRSMVSANPLNEHGRDGQNDTANARRGQRVLVTVSSEDEAAVRESVRTRLENARARRRAGRAVQPPGTSHHHRRVDINPAYASDSTVSL